MALIFRPPCSALLLTPQFPAPRSQSAVQAFELADLGDVLVLPQRDEDFVERLQLGLHPDTNQPQHPPQCKAELGLCQAYQIGDPPLSGGMANARTRPVNRSRVYVEVRHPGVERSTFEVPGRGGEGLGDTACAMHVPFFCGGVVCPELLVCALSRLKLLERCARRSGKARVRMSVGTKGKPLTYRLWARAPVQSQTLLAAPESALNPHRGVRAQRPNGPLASSAWCAFSMDSRRCEDSFFRLSRSKHQRKRRVRGCPPCDKKNQHCRSTAILDETTCQ